MIILGRHMTEIVYLYGAETLECRKCIGVAVRRVYIARRESILYIYKIYSNLRLRQISTIDLVYPDVLEDVF